MYFYIIVGIILMFCVDQYLFIVIIIGILICFSIKHKNMNVVMNQNEIYRSSQYTNKFKNNTDIKTTYLIHSTLKDIK